MTKPNPPNPNRNLRDAILSHFATLGVAIDPDEFDAHLSRAEKERRTALELLHAILAEQAGRRQQRGIERRIQAAKFRDPYTLDGFDWKFNAKEIDRTQIEELATCDFVRRHDSVLLIGQSGVGKSRIVQSIGRQACVLGYRVRYATSGTLLGILNAALADKTLERTVAQLARLDLLIIDEFGFDRLERTEAQQAVSLLYKLIDARSQKQSTILVSNVDFDAWGEYLGDPPLAMALLDRLVDGAVILKIRGKSYRAKRRPDPPENPTDPPNEQDDPPPNPPDEPTAPTKPTKPKKPIK